MGGPSTRTVADKQTSIQVQTSAYGICNPVVYGTNRISANLVWFGNFTATDKTTKTGGKGGGSSSTTTYTYKAAAILALAEGAIAGIGSVWKDKDKTTLAALGLSLFTGADTQSTWSFLTGYATSPNFDYDKIFGYQGLPAFVDQAINYSGTAYLAASAYELGESATIPNHSFEVQGKLIFAGGSDALPSTVIPDILTAQRYGVGFPAASIDALASYQQYCQALGLFISPTYVQSRAGSDVIQELCDATNSAVLWSGGLLKIIPYGDTAITGNGATYTPNLTPLFDLADDDFLDRDDGPVTVTRKTPADAYNRIGVQFRNRANQYNQEVVTVEDQDAIEKYGLKIASNLTCDFICTSAIAKQVAQLALQRQLYKRNEYEFELGARYAMLEPMDIVTLTDAGLGMNRVPVRLIEVEEQDDGFRCVAEDLPIGIAAAATYAHDNGLRWQNTTAIPPLSCAAPIIFELPSETSTTELALAVAAGETIGDSMYGGCRVWLSLDGTNYREEGVILGSSRYGTLSAAMASGNIGINAADSLAVSLRSGGQMISGSAADMQKGTTQLIVGDEYMAFQTATLTGANAYTLSNLNRGLYRTTPSAKASGTGWVRVDEAVAQLVDITPAMIGQTVYIKLTAFNVYGAAEQSLASVSAYTYTISGKMKDLSPTIDAGNLLYDPTLGSGSAATANAFYEDTGTSSSGRDRFRIRLDANNAAWFIQNKLIPVSAGERLYMRGYFYSGAAGIGTGRFAAQCYSTNLVSSAGDVIGPQMASTAVGPWTLVEGYVVIPAGTAFIKPYFQRLGGTGSSFFFAEPIISRHQLGATQNVDGANMIPDPLEYTGGSLANGAIYTVLNSAGRPAERKAVELAFAANSAGRWGPLMACRPGETLFYQHAVKSNGTGGETCNASFSYFDASGGALGAVNLGGAPYNTSRTLSAVNGVWTTVSCSVTVPAGAAFIQFYVERPTFTTNSFYVGEPVVNRAQSGADVTASNTSANTSAVGTVPASSVQSTINTGGGVAPNQVTTPSIVANAVSDPNNGVNFTGGGVSGAGYQVLASKTITLANATDAVLFLTSGLLNASASATGGGITRIRNSLRIVRSGTIIRSAFNMSDKSQSAASTASVAGPFSVILNDSPGVGTFTYEIQVSVLQTGGGGTIGYNCDAIDGSLAALILKR